MKKEALSVLLLLLFSILPVTIHAQEWTGKILSVGENVTTLQTGKWYFLYNAYTMSYTKEASGNTLIVSTESPNGLDAESALGYLVQLEDAGETDKYYLKSGLGNYYRNVGTSANNGTEATTRSTSIYTIVQFGSEGHWSLRSNNRYYLQSANGKLVGGNGTGSAGGDRDWVFREVTYTSTDELEGAAYVKYMLNKGGLIRITNRRSSTQNLTDNGTKTLGVKANKNTLQQVWILEKKGEGYTLRNGETGKYLASDDNYRSPSLTAKTLYIQYSPNNSGKTAYINISEKSDFSGTSCLNLNGDGVTLYKWSYQGDAGSDWTIAAVDNYSLEEVQAGLLAQSGFKEPQVGKYYRIRNMNYNTYMTEDFAANTVGCEGQNDDKLSQYWTLVSAGTGKMFHIQNLCTQRYITRQSGTLSTQYRTQADKPSVGFSMTRTSDATNLLYYIGDNGNVGLHCDASSKVVGWATTDISASTWGFEEVELTDEFIQNGRGNLNTYSELTKKLTKYKTALANLFKDNACTELKDEIQALTDEALAENEHFKTLNADIQAMILKVKNNTWETYTRDNGYSRDFEKFFRVRDDYQVYSHFQRMAENQYCGMSNAFGKLSGPTGICGNSGDIIYIYVDEEPSSDCTLQVEVVVDSESPGSHQTGATTALHRGLNAIVLSNKSTLYIFYQLNNPEKYLANYPNMKIHIEGGQVQGYWDATRGMTNDDWMLLREKMLNKSNVLNLKCKRLVFVMRNDLVQKAISADNNMEGLMRVWNTMLQNEEDLMGFQEKVEGRFNNIWNCFSIDHSYMYATTYGTYYENSTLSTVMSYKALTETGGGALWGPSHEMGHNHQACINGVGSTETSNNLFSNVNVFLHGVSTSRGDAAETCFADFAADKSWVQRGTWAQARFYYQLYLYYHVTCRNTNFYPKLFTLLRQDPINKGSWDSSLEADSDGDGTMDVKGGYKSYGKNDYLHIAKKMCDAAGEDLSEFFEAYGMFIPVSNFYVGDYSNYWVTTTQADIDAAKAYMHRYPKAGNLIFIEDRIKQSPSISGGPLEGKPKSTYRVPISDEDCNQIGTHGDVGQYSDYVDDYMTDGYYYQTTTSQGVTTYKIFGSGAVGFKVYDNNGKLVYLSNKKSFTLPAAVQKKVKDGFTIYAAEGNGYDVLVPFGPALYRGEMTAYYEGNPTPHTLYYFGTGTAGKSEIGTLPVNSIVYIKEGQTDKKQPTEELLQKANVVSAEGVAQQLQIDGDKPFFIPTDFTAQQVTFTKEGTGYQALSLPFNITEGYVGVILDHELYVDFETAAAGEPVVIEGKANLTANQVTVNAGTFAQTKVGFVLDAEGKSVVEAQDITPFTYVFNEAFTLGDDETSLDEELRVKNEKSVETIYDLSGRKINAQCSMINGQLTKGIYIINGRKIFIK